MGEGIHTIVKTTSPERKSERLEEQGVVRQPAKKSVSVSKETPWLKKLVLNRIRQYGTAELIYDKYGKKPTQNYSIPGYMSDAVKKWAKRQGLDVWYGTTNHGADTIKFGKKK